jgi:hypothetical protein
MKKFIEFLERNNAWENFERAFREHGKDVESYKKYCKKFKHEELRSAFIWPETREGYDYWLELDLKWTDENKSLKEKLLSDD